VEECTRAEIGVGAAIAIGNQGENGNKALLVIKVIKRSALIRPSLFTKHEKLVRVGMYEKYIAIVTKKKQSPIRFIKRVNNPEVIEDWF
jgi:L-cysteine desulfidase